MLLKKSSRAVSAMNRLIAAHEKPFVFKGSAFDPRGAEL